MGERLTKERLDEIRAYAASEEPDSMRRGDWLAAMMRSDGRKAARDLLAEVDALTAERDMWAASAGRWAGDATVNEDARHAAEAGLSVSETIRRSDEADLAETRAQLARLREAASGLLSSARDAIVASWDARLDDRDRGGVVIDRAAYARLAASVTLHVDAISDPGPTLAQIRAEALRMAADRHTTPDDIRMWLRMRAADIEAGRG